MISFEEAMAITQRWLDENRDPSAPAHVLDDQTDALEDGQFWAIAHDAEIPIDGLPLPLIDKNTGEVFELLLPGGITRLESMRPALPMNSREQS